MTKACHYFTIATITAIGFWSCGKSEEKPDPTPPPPKPLTVKSIQLNNATLNDLIYDVPTRPGIRVHFSEPLLSSSVAAAVKLTDPSGSTSVSTSLQNGDSVLLITPGADLKYLSRHTLQVTSALKSAGGASLNTVLSRSFVTKIDSSNKFSLLSDEELLTLVQRQTFKYFWDFGHPVSGLARERNTSGDIVTSGGSGFGIMAIVTATDRNFITRAQALSRLQTMVAFLKDKAKTFHGAYPHWLNGATGQAEPFSQKDNGADLVETSFLVMGLITARQYFDRAEAAETALRNDINTICNRVEWNWFRKNDEQVLYWHWSENYGWEMNHPVRGWNECLITYVLGASSATHGIPKSVYDQGWKGLGANGFLNGNKYYDITLPLGPAYGGPLFFSHYSFLGIDPNGLSDVHTNYKTQNTSHTQINYKYCIANPKNHYGYSSKVSVLTASDIEGAYTHSSPTNDIGVIAPTAALAFFPYTPQESMDALKFYYYVLGDKLWKEYGFVDAFSLKDQWFANSFIAIDQAPIIIMIENYRSGLLWELFTSAPEVQQGMKTLGFSAPYL